MPIEKPKLRTPSAKSRGRPWLILLLFAGVLICIGLISLSPSSSTWFLSTFMFSSESDSLGSACVAPSDDSLLGIYGPLVDEVEVFELTSHSDVAKALFRQGLMQMWNFNTPEALRNFEASVNHDREGCALCYWGIASARGSNINRFVDADDVQASVKALEAAQRILSAAHTGDGADNSNQQVSRFEEMLVETQTSRWPTGGTGNETNEWKANGQDYYDQRYANKLTSVVALLETKTVWSPWQQVFTKTLSSESVITVHRWDYFRTEPGTPQPDGSSPPLPTKLLRAEIEPAYETLRQVLLDSPTHPLALHLWIHLTEQSSEPATGEKEADRLASYLLERSSKLGHLVHMPAHTYLRMGQYEKAIESSIHSIDIDRAYDQQCLEPYCPHHNIAVLIHSAMHSARKGLAVQWAPTHGAELTNHATAMYISGLFLTPLEFVYSKFGDWAALKELRTGVDSVTASAQAVLDRELSDAEVPAFLRAIAAYGKALSATHSQTGTDAGAAAELSKLERVADEIQSDEDAYSMPKNHVFYPFHRETGALMVAIATAALEVRRGNAQAAVTTLRSAVALQDGFHYMEPEHFYTPLRHCLGAALLLQAEESTTNTDAETPLFEAISVYERDLAEHPNNVWAYTGLQETYHRLQKLGHHHDLEAAEVDQALRLASSKAEVRLGGSCCELSLC